MKNPEQSPISASNLDVRETKEYVMDKEMAAEAEKSFPIVGIGASTGDRRPSSPFSSGMLADVADLRKQAEALARENTPQSPEQLVPLSPEATRQMLNELRVHQIELEMQNENLRLAQVELDATKALYFDLYNLAPVGYVTVSEKGLIMDANITVASLLGIAPSEVVKKPISQFVFKEDQDIYFLHSKELFETQTRQACELRMVKTDGTIFWVRMEATVAHNSDDTPICRAVISDITERKQAEAVQQRARASENLRQCLIALNNCADFDSALACLVRQVVDSGNADCAALYLIEGQDAVLRHQIGFTPDFVEQVARRPLSTGYIKASLENPHEIINVIGQFQEQRQLCEAYGLRHVYCMALMAGEQPFGFLNVGSRCVEPPNASDIELIRILALETGSAFLRLRVEARLMRVNAEQRIILDTTPMGIIHVKDRKVQWANPAFSRILGYTDEESVGLDTASFYANREEYERVGVAGYEQLSQGKSYSVEIQLKRKDGSLLWASMAGSSMAPQKQSEGSIWTLLDVTERKLMLEAIKDSEILHRSILATMTEGVVVQMADGIITDCNLNAERLSGFRRDEIKGHTSVDPHWQAVRADGSPFPGEDHPSMVSLRTGQACHDVLMGLKQADGSTRWLNVNSEPMISDGKTRPYAVVISFSDITERKQIMEQLRETSDKLLEAQRIAHLGSYVFDARTGMFTSTEVLDELFGIVDPGFTKDVAGWLEIVHPEDRAEMQRYLNDEVLKGQSAFDRDYRIVRHNDHQERWVHGLGKVVFDDHGQPIQMIGTIQDITEHKQAEDALSESRELLSLFMRHSPIYAFIKDATPTESRVLLASENFHQMLGPQGVNIQGRTMADLYPPDLAAQIAADDRTVIANGQVMSLEEDFNGRNYNTIKYPIVKGGKTLVAGYIIDITERKQLEAQQKKLEFQNRQLQKSESLGRMAGAIAHHFNNQLQVVMMNLQLAMQTLPRNAEPVEKLTEAMHSARKAAEVSTLMLTYLGQTAAKHEPLDLCETCQRHMPMLRTVMPQSVTLKTDLASPGPVINANANQIQQILTNLLTNAWESMSETRGGVRLTVKTVAAMDIPTVNRFPIDCQVQDQAYACLEVADAGCGIASKDIEKVFDPFFSTKFTGRGLGLSVVLGIVRAHGGVVTVESQLGQASIFRVFLPLSSEAIPKKPAHVAQIPKTAGGAVLVVDDEPSLRKAVTLVLKRSGFTVFEAKDGVEAMEMFQKHQDEIGCVLCDLTMPRMNGWETLTALRKLVPDISVILSSGYSEAQAMDGEHPELPQAFLSKPYEWTALRDTIVRFMRSPKASS